MDHSTQSKNTASGREQGAGGSGRYQGRGGDSSRPPGKGGPSRPQGKGGPSRPPGKGDGPNRAPGKGGPSRPPGKGGGPNRPPGKSGGSNNRQSSKGGRPQGRTTTRREEPELDLDMELTPAAKEARGKPAPRGGNGAAARSAGKGSQPAPKPAKEVKRIVTDVEVGDFITVRDLATLMERSPIDLIKILMQYGIMAPITHSIDHDTAVILGEELGVKVAWPPREITPEEEAAILAEEEAKPKPSLVKQIIGDESEATLTERPPVVAVLGHVDHGKTTLLDRIRHTDVASGEAGGITQRTGAYQVIVQGRRITFLDTPGHEAFTAMRARGARVTDIVVLVVAADDGVMPQTKEAISHARAAGVPIIVALNKVDKPNANPERVMEELAKEGLQPEQWGGDTIIAPVSALRNQGIDDLLANILVVAELENLRANPHGKLVGTVIEASLDKHRGVTATLLVQNGALHPGDVVVVGNTWGRIKAMFDYEGKAIRSAWPSMPVIALGLQESPNAGEVFTSVESDREAKAISEERKLAEQAKAGLVVKPRMSLEEIFAKFEGGETKTLNLIVRADLQGTLEPVLQTLQDLSSDKIQIKILQDAVGNITESDVMLAEASDAVIIGFSVSVDRAAAARAEQSGVEIRHYDVIYKMIEDVQDALKGMLDPVYEERVTGHAQVLQLFKLRRGAIAGCMVSDGVVKRNALARVLRAGQPLITSTRIETLRRFTEDVAEVRMGFECGIKVQDRSDDVAVGDVIELYEKVRVR